MKLKNKIIIYEILSTLTLLLPMAILFIIKRKDYFKNISPFTLTLAGITCIIFAIMLVKEKVEKSGKKVVNSLIICIFTYIFEPFLSELKIISFVAFIGIVLNYLLFENKIKKLKKQMEIEYTADIISDKIGGKINGK